MFSFLGQGVLGELLAPTRTPGQQLHSAVEDGLNDKAMRLIQEERVDFNYPDPMRDDMLPIHTACKSGNRMMVDTLLQLGADINSRDKYGNTPLHFAAKSGKIDLVKHLVSQGADVARRNMYRQTAYDVCADNHVVRQYLLPLQLRAEPEPAPNALLAVHNPDAIRDYSNLPPPPTGMMPMASPPQGVPQQSGIPTGTSPVPMPVPQYNIKPGGWTDPSVTRPIAADGFHCSAGDPELAAKYGHIKQQVVMAPPPTVPRADGASPTVPTTFTPPPQQYSAFSNGRPNLPRYVAYNAAEGTAAAPYLPKPGGVGGSPVRGPEQTYGVPVGTVQGGAASGPAMQSYSYPLPTQPTVQSPQRPTPQLPQAVPAPPAVRQTAPTSGGIPTQPAPNTISVFQPLPDNGDDAIELDGSASKLA